MSLPEETKPPVLKMMMKIELKCMILTFSRIFMLDSAKESGPPSTDGAVVHWLNAINPELFTEQAIRYVKKTKKTRQNKTPIIIPPISRHTVDTHMLVHTQTHMHAQSRMLGHLTHTSTHCIENHMCVCVCVWSCGLVLYVWMCNQTSPLLRASSLSCRGNVTQMQAGEENNKLPLPLSLILFMLMVASFCFVLGFFFLRTRWQWSRRWCVCSCPCVEAYMHTCVSSYRYWPPRCSQSAHTPPLQPYCPPLTLDSTSLPSHLPHCQRWCHCVMMEHKSKWAPPPSSAFPAPKYWRAEISLFLWPLYFFAPTSCLHTGAPAGGHTMALGQNLRSSSWIQPAAARFLPSPLK